MSSLSSAHLIPFVCGILAPHENMPTPVASDSAAITNPAALANNTIGDHEAVEGVVGVVTSEHFAIKWGDGGSLEPTQATEALAALEAAWTVQIEQLGFTRPFGMDVARMNVYLGNTGLLMGGQPLLIPAYAGGIYGFDPAGWPLIVMNPLIWQTDPNGEYVEMALAHEFHHTTQITAHLYDNDKWWTEALAVWAADQQRPGSLLTWAQAGLLVQQPEVGLEFVATDVESALFAHHYGAFALPFTIAEDFEHPDIIVRWSTDNNGNRDVLGRLAELLKGEGLSLDHAVTTMWASLQTGHPGGVALLGELARDPAVADHNPTFELAVGGDWGSPTAALRPQRNGANVVHIASPVDDLVVTIESPVTGSAQTPVRWGIAAVRCTAASPCEASVLQSGEASNVVQIPAAGADSVDLVIVALADTYVGEQVVRGKLEPAETFDYRVRADVDEGAVGCSCTGGSAAGLFSLLCAGSFSFVALRRRAAQAPRVRAPLL